MTTLFTPYDFAGITLQNRIVMAPMTRSRAMEDAADVATALYYSQRATAGLIITEGTPISREGQGYLFNPGIFTPEQIEGWRLTTNSVHAVGGKIFAQLWHVGRVSHPSLQPDGAAPRSAGSKLAEGAAAFAYNDEGKPSFVPVTKPEPFSTEEVTRVVQDFAKAAANAVEAGFDGVELHGANGYLFEQFMNPGVNDRDDRYSGSPENRLRFTLEVVDAAIARIGAHKVGIRLSPYGQLFDMPTYPDIHETYVRLATELAARGLAYIHIKDQTGYADDPDQRMLKLLAAIKEVVGDTTIIFAGNLTQDKAQHLLDEGLIDLAAFGRPYISNPDLVRRFKEGLALTTPDQATFYEGGMKGYVDYGAA